MNKKLVDSILELFQGLILKSEASRLQSLKEQKQLNNIFWFFKVNILKF